jgi:membrane associated rhomboid family serine protease
MFFPLHDQNNEPVRIVPYISFLVIGICLVVQIYQELLDLSDPSQKARVSFIYQHGLVPDTFINTKTTYPIALRIKDKSMTPEFLAEALGLPQIENSPFWIWLMPLTYMFIHGGWMHLLGNLWFFWIFSDNVEEKFGTIFFSVFILMTGAIAGIAHIMLHFSGQNTLIGLSGTVAAVMGAYIILFPSHRITSYFCPVWFFIRRIDVPAVLVLGMYILFEFLAFAQTSVQSDVAIDCHIAGFFAGSLIAFLVKKRN